MLPVGASEVAFPLSGSVGGFARRQRQVLLADYDSQHACLGRATFSNAPFADALLLPRPMCLPLW